MQKKNALHQILDNESMLRLELDPQCVRRRTIWGNTVEPPGRRSRAGCHILYFDKTEKRFNFCALTNSCAG